MGADPSGAAEGPGPGTPQQPAERRGATAGTDGGDLLEVPQRDFLAAVGERVVVFDGGMGATLEQFDLGPADYGGLEGKCHEALVLHRPDVIEGVHASMLEAGAEVVETDTFQASRLKLEEWGLGEHTLEINVKAAADRAEGRRRGPLRRRLDRPDRAPARLRRPDARQDHLPRAGRGVHRAGAGPRRGRRRPADHRDRAGHPRGQGGGVRRARGVRGDRRRRSRSSARSRCCRRAARCCWAPTSRRC